MQRKQIQPNTSVNHYKHTPLTAQQYDLKTPGSLPPIQCNRATSANLFKQAEKTTLRTPKILNHITPKINNSFACTTDMGAQGIVNLALRNQDEQEQMIQNLTKQIKQIEQKIQEYDQSNEVIKTQCMLIEQKQIMQQPQVLDRERKITKLKREVAATKQHITKSVEECRQMIQEIRGNKFNQVIVDTQDNTSPQQFLSYEQLQIKLNGQQMILDQSHKEYQNNQSQIMVLLNSIQHLEQQNAMITQALSHSDAATLNTQYEVLKDIQTRLEQEQQVQKQLLSEQEHEIDDLFSRVHDIIACDEFVNQQKYADELEEEKIESRNIEHLQTQNDCLQYQIDNELNEDLVMQEDQNQQLKSQMIAYGQSQGFSINYTDLEIGEYLDMLTVSMLEKRHQASLKQGEEYLDYSMKYNYEESQERPQTQQYNEHQEYTYTQDDYLNVQYDSEEALNEDDFAQNYIQSQFFTVSRVNGEYEIKMLVDPSIMDVAELLELFQQIDQMGRYLKKQSVPNPHKTQNIDEDSDIVYGSEHDTIDSAHDRFYDENQLNQYNGDLDW